MNAIFPLSKKQLAELTLYKTIKRLVWLANEMGQTNVKEAYYQIYNEAFRRINILTTKKCCHHECHNEARKIEK